MKAAAGFGKSTFAFALLAALPAAALAAAFLLPYAAAAAAGVGRFAAAAADPELSRVLGFTAAQAAASTAAALAIGLPGAWLAGSGRFRGSRTVRALASVPFAMPPILVVLGFVLFFGNNGWANRAAMSLFGLAEPPLRVLYRPAAIVLAHAFYNFPIVLRLSGDAFAAARRAYAPAAESLGASGGRTFLTVLLPIAAPSVAAAALLVFLYCFTSFAVVLVLGGGPGATTVPVEIYRAARISLDYGRAGALAIMETAVAALAYLAYVLMERLSRRVSGAAAERTRTDERRGAADSPGTRIAAGLYIAAVALLVAGPLASVVAESFLSRAARTSAPELSLRWWRSLSGSALPALGRSLALAAAAATLSTVLASSAALASWGFRAARRTESAERAPYGERALSAFCTAPVASSGIVLGLGWLSCYGTATARSVWAVALVHAVAALPFAYRSISEGFRALPDRTADASASLGAPPLLTAFRIALPAAGRRIGSAWAFAAAVSLGELNAVLMLGLDGFETLPLLMYRAAGSYRFGAACAAGVLLAAACTGAFIVSEREA